MVKHYEGSTIRRRRVVGRRHGRRTRGNGLPPAGRTLRGLPPLRYRHRVARFEGVLFGSPTLEDEVLPTVAGFLSYLRGLSPGRLAQKKIGFAFGSHGGHGGAVKQISESMQKAGIEVAGDGYEVMFRPDADEREACYQAGLALADKVRSL